MFYAIIAASLVRLSQFDIVTARPVDGIDGFIVTHTASDYLPHAKGDLALFDVDVMYYGLDDITKSWFQDLDPSSGTTDWDKAVMLTEAAYAKPYDANDEDMAGDVDALLATVAGNTTSLEVRSDFRLSGRHAFQWASCAGFLSCVSGSTCNFNLNIGSAPRSRCEKHGNSNCCISWSDYNVRVGFFQATWTVCNREVQEEHRDYASCEGYGHKDQGGDVCLSNRANGCT